MCITNTYIKNKYIVRSLTGSENSLHVLATMTECTLIESASQLQSSPTCRDVVKKKKCGNSNCQSDTFIKPSSKMADHGGGGDSPE